MNHQQDRATLLETVRSLRNEIEQLIAEVDGSGKPQRGASDAWTIEDIIAHLTSWRLRTAARLEAALQGEEPSMPWPEPLEEEDDLEEINRWFFENNRNKPLAEIRRESRETFDRVERAITALPERDLLEPDRFPWLAGYALGPAVVSGTLEHYREHEPEIRAMLGDGR